MTIQPRASQSHGRRRSSRAWQASTTSSSRSASASCSRCRQPVLGASRPVLDRSSRCSSTSRPCAASARARSAQAASTRAGSSSRPCPSRIATPQHARVGGHPLDRLAPRHRGAAGGVAGEVPPGGGQRHSGPGLLRRHQDGADRPRRTRPVRQCADRQRQDLAVGAGCGQHDAGLVGESVMGADRLAHLPALGVQRGRGVAGQRRRRQPPARRLGAAEAALGQRGTRSRRRT